MWCRIKTVAFNEESDWQVVEYILFELVSGILGQYLKEARFLR